MVTLFRVTKPIWLWFVQQFFRCEGPKQLMNALIISSLSRILKFSGSNLVILIIFQRFHNLIQCDNFWLPYKPKKINYRLNLNEPWLTCQGGGGKSGGGVGGRRSPERRERCRRDPIRRVLLFNLLTSLLLLFGFWWFLLFSLELCILISFAVKSSRMSSSLLKMILVNSLFCCEVLFSVLMLTSKSLALSFLKSLNSGDTSIIMPHSPFASWSFKVDFLVWVSGLSLRSLLMAIENDNWTSDKTINSTNIRIVNTKLFPHIAIRIYSFPLIDNVVYVLLVMNKCT